jgi:hypothetical protein
MTDQPPKRIAGGYASLRDAFRAAEAKRAANVAAFFQPEATDEPPIDADNTGDTSSAPTYTDEQIDAWMRRSR